MREVEEKNIDSKDILAVLDKGPGAFFDILSEFCSDVETLTDSIKTLYDQNYLVFAMAGVTVEVKVHAAKLNEDLFSAKLGSDGLIAIPKDKKEETA